MRVLMAGGLVAWMTVLGFAQQARTTAPVLTAASADGFETIVKPFLAANCVRSESTRLNSSHCALSRMPSSA